MKPLFLKIFYQGKLLKVCPFTDDQISIGSGEGLSLKLKGIAPWHTIIEKKWDRYTIFDLGSDTGTVVNGQKIAGEQALESGSFFRIGPYEIQFFVGPPPVSSPAPSSSGQAVREKKTASPVTPPLETPSLSSEPPPAKPASPPLRKPAPSSEIPSMKSPEPTLSKSVPISPKKEVSFEEEGTSSVMSSPTESVPFSPEREVSSEIKVFKKPPGKGFWRTFAPSDKIQNLDEYLEPSVGNFIEVLVSWKNRILDSFHFHKRGQIYMGSSSDCEIPVSNLIRMKKYKLLEISEGARVCLDHGIKGALIQRKNNREGQERIIHPINHSLVLKPYEIVRVDFKNLLRVYVRFKSKPTPPVPVGLLNLTFSESAALFFSLLTTGILLFYAGLYAPTFLQKEEDFLEQNIIQAVVKFERKYVPPPPKPEVVKMKLSDKTRAEKKKAIVKQVKKKTPRKKPKPVVIRKSRKPKVIPKKTAGIKKKGKKPGKIATVAKGRKPPVKQKIAAGSARPGGSLKTGKSGSTAKTVAPDPTKTGLLGVFGGGGSLKKLDTGATGSTGGGLLGLAETSTGFAGTREGYEGEGVGTKTKELATGGQGTALVGIKGIRTKGRGGNLFGKGKGRGGSLGSRGKVNINIGADDIEVEGEIDREGIRRVILRNQLKFDKCYQFSLQQQSSLEGVIKMEWQILSNGSVRAVSAIRDSVGSSELVNCMRRTLSRLRFPPPPKGQIPKVAFPFSFSI